MAHGLDKGRGEADKDTRVIAVIGDSTFMHMGIQGLLDMVYNRGNVTILLLDNRTVAIYLPFSADILKNAILDRFRARKPKFLSINEQAFEAGRAAQAAAV